MNSRTARTLLCAVLILAMADVVASDGGPDWVRSPEEAFRLGESAGQPIVVDVFADWCQPCWAMERDTWANPQVVSALEAFVALKLDADVYESFADRHGVDTLPTTLVLDDRGRTIASIAGAVGPGTILRVLATVRDGYGSYLDHIDRADDFTAAEQVAQYLYDAGNMPGAADALSRAVDIARDAGTPAAKVEEIELKLAQMTFAAGDHDTGSRLLERLANSATGPRVKSWALAGVVETRRLIGDRTGADMALTRLRAEFPDVARQLESATGAATDRPSSPPSD